MSTEPKNAEAFVERLKTDEAFRNTIGSGLVAPEDLIQRAEAEGYQFTAIELQRAIHGIAKAAGLDGNALTEDELKDITGGWAWVVTSVKMAIAAFGASVGAKTVKNAFD